MLLNSLLTGSPRPARNQKRHSLGQRLDRMGCRTKSITILVLGAKAKAVLDGRPAPEIDDIKAMARPVLRHRLITNFNAEAEGLSTDDILSILLEDDTK
ncbi:MAG: hypothetical protein CM1200mP10_12510 [Candidatus Neomarinimicrobiota bacterium]|nr:MAG: hypothetical protein CM1200mP10_12510 [Candidatus Neomarinimicrobiota bacterium]